MMENNVENSPAAATLTLTGDLTIEKARELHQKLLTALEQTQNLTIKFEGVTRVDLAFLQLLGAAHRTALKTDKFFRVEQDPSENLCRQIEEAGFRRDQGCTLDCQGSCLWKRGKT